MLGLSKLATLVAEFLGTTVLTLVVLSVTKSGVGFSVFIAGGAGLAFAVLLYVVGRYSLGHYNPTATISLWSVRRIPTIDAIALLAAQVLGALAAWRLFEYMANQPLQSLQSQSFNFRSFTAEMIGGFIFMLALTAVLARKANNAEWAITAGVALFLGMMLASIGSNGLINPAIAFGVGVRSWNWTEFVAPVVGGIIGANVYAWLFAPAKTGVQLMAASVETTKSSSKSTTKKKQNHSTTKRRK